jgi:hypothetical protein
MGAYGSRSRGVGRCTDLSFYLASPTIEVQARSDPIKGPGPRQNIGHHGGSNSAGHAPRPARRSPLATGTTAEIEEERRLLYVLLKQN